MAANPLNVPFSCTLKCMMGKGGMSGSSGIARDEGEELERAHLMYPAVRGEQAGRRASQAAWRGHVCSPC